MDPCMAFELRRQNATQAHSIRGITDRAAAARIAYRDTRTGSDGGSDRDVDGPDSTTGGACRSSGRVQWDAPRRWSADTSCCVYHSPSVPMSYDR